MWGINVSSHGITSIDYVCRFNSNNPECDSEYKQHRQIDKYTPVDIPSVVSCLESG